MLKKIIQIIDSSRTYVADKENLAEHLIENGVTIPVLCKDCKHYIEETLTCKPKLSLAFEHPNWYPDDFCSYGERRTDAN